MNPGPLTVLNSGALLNNMLVWQMDASGPVTGSGETTFITAGFNGVFTPILSPPGAVIGMTGQTSQAQIQIVPVPGAILLGIVGTGWVTWMRRRIAI